MKSLILSMIALNVMRLLRKLIGWGLVILSVFFLAASLSFLIILDYGPFITGLLFSLLVFAMGLQIETDIEKRRKRILALMKKYFPKCPICRSDEGYENRGWLASSQYVRCKICGAQWTSTDFSSIKKLSKLKLWEPPEDPEVYATFIYQSPLKLRKTYPIEVWQAEMKGEAIEIPTEQRTIKDFFVLRRKGLTLGLISFIILLSGLFSLSSNYVLGCAATSLGTSILVAIFGYYFFSLDEGKSYTLFVTAFLAIFFGLMVLPF